MKKRNASNRKHQDFMPLSQTHHCILASLSGGPKHGYAIMEDVAEGTGGAVRLATGNLYVGLRDLLEIGLIERVEDAAHPTRPFARKAVYRILEAGEMALYADALHQQHEAALHRPSALTT